MSGLFASLNSSVKALSAHARAITVTGKNLANVNNTDYSRQRVVYGDRGTVITAQGAESLGLEALAVQHIRDQLIDQQLMREISLKSSFEAEQGGYQRAQAGLGQSIERLGASADAASGGTGLAAALDGFFNGFQSFAARPTDIGERQTLLQKASILTDQFALVDSRLGQAQSDLDAQIGTDVEEVSRLLETIADLNAQVGRFEVNAPGSAVDIRDQRQARLEQLSARIPVEIRGVSDGQVEIVTRAAGGADVVLVSRTSVANPVSFNGSEVHAGGTRLDPSSGSIHGALRARDGAIAGLRADLDGLAAQLVTSVNGAYNPGGTTGDFFSAGGLSAGTIALSAGLGATTLKASDGGPAGDNAVAMAVARLASQSFSTAGGDRIDGTFSGFYATSVSRLGQALAGANSRLEDQENIERLVRSQRDTVSGVSLDEELADLMKYQRAFQASSRVFTVVDDLLDVVVNRLGRA